MTNRVQELSSTHKQALQEAQKIIKSGKCAGLIPANGQKTEADYENYALLNRCAQIMYIEENGSTKTVSVPSNREDK